MRLTKTLLIENVAEDTGFTRRKTAETINLLLEILQGTLESGETIRIGNLGKFYVRERKARRWRNPATGRVMRLPDRRIVKFKGFKKLSLELNAQGSEETDQTPAVAAPYLVGDNIWKAERLKEILENHKRWVRSRKKIGHKAVLKNKVLSQVDFYAAFLPQVNFQGADLQGADMSEADLYGANLQGANLTGAVLTWAILDEAKLMKASLEGADLRWANLEGADLTEANLRWANFQGANLREAKLFGADLFGATLKNTDMEDAVFTGVKLDAENESKLPGTITEKVS